MLRAVIFDMDGTITRPNLDFDKIRAEVGITDGRTLLEWLAEQPEPVRRRAWEVIHRHELEAALTAEPAEGAQEVLAAAAEMGLGCGLVTRNNRRSVGIVLARLGLRFDAVVTREDCAPKPSPEPVLLCARRLGVTPPETLVVGDFRYDIESGRSAGARTAFLSPAGTAPGRGSEPAPPADYHLRSLRELIPILHSLARSG